MARSVTVLGPSGKACRCQVDASSTSYHCVSLGNPSLSFLLCEMDLVTYLHLGVVVKVDKEKRW